MAGDARKAGEIVVFSVLRDSACAECGHEIRGGEFLRVERERPLCMACADLDHLVYLPRGDAALTRRATKLSPLRVVVVRISRARGRYERQGALVTRHALSKAETECLAGEDARARRRERQRQQRALLDEAYIREFARHIAGRYPGCSEGEATAIAEHACTKYSGRAGRTERAKEFAPEASDLAVRAHVRHVHTRYDTLMDGGADRREARDAVAGAVEAVLVRWRTPG